MLSICRCEGKENDNTSQHCVEKAIRHCSSWNQDCRPATGRFSNAACVVALMKGGYSGIESELSDACHLVVKPLSTLVAYLQLQLNKCRIQAARKPIELPDQEAWKQKDAGSGG